jgi:hypothetical protein
VAVEVGVSVLEDVKDGELDAVPVTLAVCEVDVVGKADKDGD